MLYLIKQLNYRIFPKIVLISTTFWSENANHAICVVCLYWFCVFCIYLSWKL